MRKLKTKASLETELLKGQISISRWHGGRGVAYELSMVNKPKALILERGREFPTIEKAIAYSIKHGCMPQDWSVETKNLENPPETSEEI